MSKSTIPESGLVVLEGEWWPNSNVSVKSLFDVLVDINFDSPHSYYFSSFANHEALRDILAAECGHHTKEKYLYIATHGDASQIAGSVKVMSRTLFRNTLQKLGTHMKGVYLGACLFGHNYNAEFLFGEQGVPPTVTWIAGYGMEIDWIDSSVLDVLFWNTLFRLERSHHDASPVELIKHVCEQIWKDAPGLIERLQFQVFVRHRGPGTEPKPLLDY
jgi:hypothetical protein